jgi:PAS domain S-box-containing protein
MWDFLTLLFDTSGFPPRWQCGSWTTAHGWLHVFSDLGVWSAYVAIPFVLGYFVLRRKDIPFRLVFVLFGAFILACGTTHLMEAIIFWWPGYRLAGVIKLATALVSWATVITLVEVTPKVLAMRTPEELEREIERRKQVETEQRGVVEALKRSEAMFQGMFQFAPDTILVSAADGRIRQANLQAEHTFGYRREELIGQLVEVLIPERVHGNEGQHGAIYAVGPQRRRMGDGRELFGRRKNGEEFPVEVTLASLETREGQLEFSTVRDISHRKANEAIIKARGRQAAALAEIGQRALASSDIHALLGEAVALVARTLDADLGLFMELTNGGKDLVLRVGWGWKPECFDQKLFGDGTGSQAEYCLMAEQPVIVTNARTETRFIPSPHLLQLGAVSGLCVNVKGKAGAHGMLAANTKTLRQFTVEDVVFIKTFGNLLGAIIDRAQAERQVQASLAEKEVLLKEVHHRVKNNLQVISSLLDLQSGHTADAFAVEMFRESRSRVRSMALVHERLYRSGDLAKVDFATYIETLADDLFQAHWLEDKEVRLDLQVNVEVRLSIDAAIPCGLLLNELLSNSLKHAFHGRQVGTIGIELRNAEEGRLLLAVADDGIGLPKETDPWTAQSLGLQLVAMLTKQLKGTLEIDREGGTRFRIMFPAGQLQAS